MRACRRVVLRVRRPGASCVKAGMTDGVNRLVKLVLEVGQLGVYAGDDRFQVRRHLRR